MSLQAAIRYFTEQTHIMPCLSIACGVGERIEYAHGGVINAAGDPLTADSIFDLASLTKLFTGLLVMQLHEAGRLSLTAPVTRYAPQFIHLGGVTVDQVLGFEVALTTPRRIDTQPDRDAALQQLFALEPGPVAGRAYSDMHAMTLKYVIEGAAQQSYEAVLQQKILHPLGMKETWCVVPEAERRRCVSCDGEHRIEHGQWMLRRGIAPGTPHDPKARMLWPEPCGHAGIFSVRGDLVKLCRGILTGRVLSEASLRRMAENRTGRRRPDGSWTQFLGSQCYVRHPVQYDSEIPVYESDRAIGLSGFTGHHLSVDPATGVFAIILGNRVLNRLTVLLPAGAQERQAQGLSPDGTGQVQWPDGERVWSSVDWVHHKDAHLHAAIQQTLQLPSWRPPEGESHTGR